MGSGVLVIAECSFCPSKEYLAVSLTDLLTAYLLEATTHLRSLLFPSFERDTYPDSFVPFSDASRSPASVSHRKLDEEVRICVTRDKFWAGWHGREEVPITRFCPSMEPASL